jgi:hypothetical protein
MATLADDKDKRNSMFVSLLELQVKKILEQGASTRPWSTIDKTKLPKECFLWIENPDKKTTWHLPYKEGTGGIDPETGMYLRAGAVNITALRAISQAVGGARTGTPMNVPAEIRAKIKRLLKKYRIGEYKESAMMESKGRELVEESISKQFADVKLDKENNKVMDVAILRPSSANCTFKEGKGRTYTKQALESVAKLIKGAKAYIDHATKSEIKERQGVRSIRDLLGYYENGRVDENNVVRADLEYLANHKEWFEPIVEQMSDKVGKSIHAYGPTYLDKESSMEIVEDISILNSADLVTETGSTLNLFESKEEVQEEDLENTNLTLNELVEKYPEVVSALKTVWESEQKDKGEFKALQGQISELEVDNKKLKEQVDVYEVKDKATEKETKILGLIEESKIQKDFITKTFLESLRSAKSDEEMKALIEDRKKLISASIKPGVKGMGDEAEIDESTPEQKVEKDKEIQEKLKKAVKAGG